MKNFCVVANYSKDGIKELIDNIHSYIVSKGGKCYVCEKSVSKNSYTNPADIPSDTECVIVIGGDGTFLKAARDLAVLSLPMTGINMGTLGFLTMTEADDALTMIDKLFNEEYSIDFRVQLAINKFGCRPDTALNDVVISRGGYSHLVGITVYVNGKVFGRYEGDGLIISTPTGSTGYNLSTGGPIVTPNVDAILITPICPHAFNARSFVIPATDEVRVLIGNVRHETEEEAYVTVDGEDYVKLTTGQEIIISKAETRCKMVVPDGVSFIDTLYTKLS